MMRAPSPSGSIDVEALASEFLHRRKTVGIIGLGYVGLPLACAAGRAGFRVVGFDIDRAKVDSIMGGVSYLEHIPSAPIRDGVQSGRLTATTDFDQLRDVHAVIICVPTPLTVHREPDLTYVERTARSVASRLRPGHLVVLESTSWPGTTVEVVRPILESGGLRSGKDFFLAFSPEREDPGNPRFSTSEIPKIVGGDGADALRLADALYGAIVQKTVTLSSTQAAEATKLTENIFRAVNIALVNELKILFDRMNIDIWEVLAAASTKPFGYMPFYPGPGLGGHCIPIDPFYLAWKAREFELPTRFIELAGQINTSMPRYVVEKLALALDEHRTCGLRGTRLLLSGMAYKKNIDDVRESPGLKLMAMLTARGAEVHFFDPHVTTIPRTREYQQLAGRRSIDWDPAALSSYDAVLIVTDHDDVDYAAIVMHSKLIVDTRNACGRRGMHGSHIIKA